MDGDDMVAVEARPRLGRVVRALAVVAAIGLPVGLLWGGAQPVAVGLIPEPWDKFAHAAVFGALAMAVGLASGWRGARAQWLGFAVAMLVGVADEWHQVFLPGRSAGLDDLTADAVGAALGAWALRWRDPARRWLLARWLSHR